VRRAPLASQGSHNDGLCSSGKLGFPTRRAAKARARLIRTGGHLYLCGECHLWHIGRIPQAVAYGMLAAEDLYGRPS
jgi:hypothetical protein